MTEPAVLMLDEPTAGVSPIVMDDLFQRMLEIRSAGIAVLMAEQNARQALAIARPGLCAGHRREPLHRHRCRAACQSGSAPVLPRRLSGAGRPRERSRPARQLCRRAGARLCRPACARRARDHARLRHIALRQSRPWRPHGLRRHGDYPRDLAAPVLGRRPRAPADGAAGAALRHPCRHRRGARRRPAGVPLLPPAAQRPHRARHGLARRHVPAERRSALHHRPRRPSIHGRRTLQS